jgi:hypothetical protein
MHSLCSCVNYEPQTSRAASGTRIRANFRKLNATHALHVRAEHVFHAVTSIKFNDFICLLAAVAIGLHVNNATSVTFLDNAVWILK